MRCSYGFIMLSAAGCLVSFAVGYGVGQGRRAPQGPALGTIEAPMPKGFLPGAVVKAARRAEVDAASQPWVNDSRWLKIDEEERPSYDRLATLISGFKEVPDARRAYYAGYNEVGVARWYGSITKKFPREGGQAVTVRVGAILKNSGTPFTQGYFENYFVSDQGDVTYLGSEDPRGDAGKGMGWIVN